LSTGRSVLTPLKFVAELPVMRLTVATYDFGHTSAYASAARKKPAKI